jgi:hypothetical protein
MEAIKHAVQEANNVKKLRPPKIYLQPYLRGPETPAEGVVKMMCTTCRAPGSIRDDDTPQYLIADGRYVVRRRSCYGTCVKSSDDVNLSRSRARKYHVPVRGDVTRVFSTSLARAIRMTQDPESSSESVQQAKGSKVELRRQLSTL